MGACSTIRVDDRQLFARRQHNIAPDWLVVAQASAKEAGLQLEPVRFPSADGTALGGLFIRQPGAKLTAVFFQGGGSISQLSYPAMLRHSAKLPLNVLLWDYRGTGTSGGQGGTAQLQADALAARDEARRLSGESLPLLYWGFSLGTLVSAHLAQYMPPDAMLMEGSLTTAQAWAENQVPWFAKPFVSIQLAETVRGYDNHQALRELRVPTLMLVGSQDIVSPPKFTRSLAQAMHHRDSCVRVVEVPEAGHGSALRRPEGMEATQALLAQVVLKAGC